MTLAASAVAARKVPVLKALWLGAVRPWRPSEVDPPRRDRVLVVLIPAVVLAAGRLTFTWFAAPTHLLVTLGAWLLYAVTARLLLPGRDPYALWAVLGGVAMLRSAVLLAVLSVRGPGHLWLRFWTAETPRSVYVTVAVAAMGWVLAAPRLGLRAC